MSLYEIVAVAAVKAGSGARAERHDVKRHAAEATKAIVQSWRGRAMPATMDFTLPARSGPFQSLGD